MGAVVGVVLPDGGGFDHQARSIQLQNGGQRVGIHVGDEDVAGQIGNTPEVEFVTQTDNGPGLLLGPFRGNFVELPHLFNQQRGGDVRVPAAVGHVVLIIALPGGGVVGQGVFKGPGHGHRQVVLMLAQLLTLFQQVVQIFVSIIGGLDNEVVENQIVGGTVAHQHLAVPVQNVAPGGADCGDGGVVGGVIRVAVGGDDLQIEQPHGVKHHDKAEKSQKNACPQACHSFHI